MGHMILLKAKEIWNFVLIVWFAFNVMGHMILPETNRVEWILKHIENFKFVSNL